MKQFNFQLTNIRPDSWKYNEFNALKPQNLRKKP